MRGSREGYRLDVHDCGSPVKVEIPKEWVWVLGQSRGKRSSGRVVLLCGNRLGTWWLNGRSKYGEGRRRRSREWLGRLSDV